MTENKEGLHFTWFTGAVNKGCFYTTSVDNGEHFTGHDRINEMGSHPQIATLPDGRLVMATYPVIKPLNDYAVMIAYTLTKGNKNYITYQRLEL